MNISLVTTWKRTQGKKCRRLQSIIPYNVKTFKIKFTLNTHMIANRHIPKRHQISSTFTQAQLLRMFFLLLTTTMDNSLKGSNIFPYSYLINCICLMGSSDYLKLKTCMELDNNTTRKTHTKVCPSPIIPRKERKSQKRRAWYCRPQNLSYN